jgi:hypothetical protein
MILSLKVQINRTHGFGKKNQLKTWSNLKVYHSIQVWGIEMRLWYCCEDLDEQDLMEFIL